MEQEMAYDRQGKSYPVADFKDDYSGDKLGFWVFLLTEGMMFGVLFLLYGIYFYRHTAMFAFSSADLNIWLGGTNTVLLLISTYTMGVATLMMRQGKLKLSAMLVGLTIFIAIVFLGIKASEWGVDISHGIYPGSKLLDAKDTGEILFFGLYFVMTGLHGLHVIIGIALMSWVLLLMRSGGIHPEHTIVMKNVTLYWDFVHLIWIVLFPLLYMIGV
ncbi:cytochrome c oxidase subunit 3 [Sulfurospirillum halorespirans]|uniref:Cytochrome c oxidase polypeptide III n=1 Tax=Sulfurospirillum halorespirans DSM 13726 TaxID=1193502 RepID=A0A1D7TIM2_9BACT|nr:cytochrome c oxidase subunit 3 [Sulfurospirillum halorespirans]AOO64724.1 cytochrome c oxidase polypeptide III [Sulfurospirillum halorespirans DSM 13726]